MAKTRKTTKPKNRRGSPEAIEKRKVARSFNTLLEGGGAGKAKLDGRTEKRRQRLIGELKDGKGGKDLKPIDVLRKVDELVKIGETSASLKRAGVKTRRTALNDDVVAHAEKVQAAYEFHKDAWKFLGIPVGKDGKVATKAAPAAKTATKRAAKKPARTTKKKTTRKR